MVIGNTYMCLWLYVLTYFTQKFYALSIIMYLWQVRKPRQSKVIHLMLTASKIAEPGFEQR